MAKPGRPRGGIKISALKFAMLPESGSIFAVAQVLGVSSLTVRGWLHNPDFPKWASKDGQPLVVKADLERWLEANGKLLPVSVADFTEALNQLPPEALEFVRAWAPQVALSNAFVGQFLAVWDKHKRGEHGGDIH